MVGGSGQRESGRIREVADLYFARFEDRLEKGLAEVRAEMKNGLAELRAEMKNGFTELRAEMKLDVSEARSEAKHGLGQLRAELADQRAELIKWMFIFWAGTVIPLAGLAIALIKL